MSTEDRSILEEDPKLRRDLPIIKVFRHQFKKNRFNIQIENLPPFFNHERFIQLAQNRFNSGARCTVSDEKRKCLTINVDKIDEVLSLLKDDVGYPPENIQV